MKSFRQDSLDGGSAHRKVSTYTVQHNTESGGNTSTPRAGFKSRTPVFQWCKIIHDIARPLRPADAKLLFVMWASEWVWDNSETLWILHHYKWSSKVKLSLKLTKHEGVWWSRGITSRILNHGTRWRWVVSSTPWPLNPRYPLDKRVGGPQSWCGSSGEWIVLMEITTNSQIVSPTGARDCPYRNFAQSVSASHSKTWEFISSPPRPGWRCGPPSLLSNGYQGLLP
jgi:hypothetical protein